MSDEFDVKICCMGAGYVGGPTMAVIAKQCPKVSSFSGRHSMGRSLARRKESSSRSPTSTVVVSSSLENQTVLENQELQFLL